MSKKVNGNEEMNQEELKNIPETPETEKEVKEKIININALKNSKGIRFVKKTIPWIAGAAAGAAILYTSMALGEKKAEELNDNLSGLLPSKDEEVTETDTL